MKIAHRENRANNWQDSKQNINESYPETFFKEVIKNNFIDKNYIYQFRFNRFSIDFAWEEKKLAIEIDGSQHERYLTQIKNDKQKEKLLKKHGWKLLRIKWKDMFNNPKKWINIAKDFID